MLLNKQDEELYRKSRRNHLYESVFRLQVHFHADQTHFHMKGFARTRFETEPQSNLKMTYLFIGWVYSSSLIKRHGENFYTTGGRANLRFPRRYSDYFLSGYRTAALIQTLTASSVFPVPRPSAWRQLSSRTSVFLTWLLMRPAPVT